MNRILKFQATMSMLDDGLLHLFISFFTKWDHHPKKMGVNYHNSPELYRASHLGMIPHRFFPDFLEQMSWWSPSDLQRIFVHHVQHPMYRQQWTSNLAELTGASWKHWKNHGIFWSLEDVWGILIGNILLMEISMGIYREISGLCVKCLCVKVSLCKARRVLKFFCVKRALCKLCSTK